MKRVMGLIGKELAMICANCGQKMPEGTAFCTNCGTALTTAAEPVGKGLGASLEAAVLANQDAIDTIEARAQAQVDEAFHDFPPIEPVQGDTPEPPAAYDPGQAAEQAQTRATAQPQATAVPVGVPFYQQDASANAHYSSQRTYDANAYGQNTGQPRYQQEYQQPSYGQPYQQPQQEWYPQPTTSRALAMVLYIAGIVGLIIGLCVRDKSDPFIAHHLNNVVVIFIGSIVGGMLAIIGIGLLILLYLLIMTIMGMVSAYNGDMKELPLIGKIHLIG